MSLLHGKIACGSALSGEIAAATGSGIRVILSTAGRDNHNAFSQHAENARISIGQCDRISPGSKENVPVTESDGVFTQYERRE
ncbi:hypothetical protein [Rhodococcus sp. AW25M09]|uniref:hypothetical protein n=1 Tax=Rhodococcus sp. AW25M09 TaxID=1268303 RepID=UPI0012F8559C|nr:hypothetical protein [Rhodococcus sp. AW25M09]